MDPSGDEKENGENFSPKAENVALTERKLADLSLEGLKKEGKGGAPKELNLKQFPSMFQVSKSLFYFPWGALASLFFSQLSSFTLCSFLSFWFTQRGEGAEQLQNVSEKHNPSPALLPL